VVGIEDNHLGWCGDGCQWFMGQELQLGSERSGRKRSNTHCVPSPIHIRMLCALLGIVSPPLVDSVFPDAWRLWIFNCFVIDCLLEIPSARMKLAGDASASDASTPVAHVLRNRFNDVDSVAVGLTKEQNTVPFAGMLLL